MTTSITLRATKGTPLTHAEMDANLTALQTTADDAAAAIVTLGTKAEAAALGVTASDTNMGSFTGTTISDSVTAKAALQALETAVETKANASALGVTASAAHMGTFTGSTIADNQTAKVGMQSLETAVELRTVATTLAASGGAALVGSDDGASGSLWTTVAGFITYLRSSVGSSILGFLQAGTGAVARTAQAKMRDAVSVKDFGAVGDGVTDDTAAIQAAIDGTGQINFPAGTYKVSSPLSITAQVMLVGGMGSAVILTNSATANVIEITGPTPGSGAANVTIDGLQFNSSVTRTGGSYIEVSNEVYNVDISRCRFTSGYNSVRNTGVGGFGFFVRNCLFYYSSNVHILIDNTAPAVGQIIENNIFLGPSVGTNSVAGIKVTCAGDLFVRANSFVYCGKDLWIAPTSGVRIQLMLVENNYFDSGTDWGVYCVTDGGRVDCIKFTNNWSATRSVGGGYYFGSTAPSPYTNNEIRQVDLTGNIGANSAQEGFRFGANVTNATIIGNTACANASDGFLFDANTNGFTVTGNRSGPSGEFAGNGGGGINIAAGTSDNYLIVGNRTYGNTGTNIADGGTGANKSIANNV